MLGLELEISYQIGVHRDRGRIWGIISRTCFVRDDIAEMEMKTDGFWDGEILSWGDMDFVVLFR